MRRKFIRGLMVCLLLMAIGARAQEVQFTNGDRLAGRWINVRGTILTVDTEEFGKMRIPIGKVGEFIVAEPFVLVTKSGKIERGERAELVTGTWQLQTQGRWSEVPADQVATIVPGHSYHQVIVETSSRPWLGWRGAANFGYNLQSGDQNTQSLSIGLHAIRSQPHLQGLPERWRTSYDFHLLFANAKSDGQKVSSNSLTTSFRQDYFFQPKRFVFGLGELDHFQSQNLYLRQTYGGGFGHDIQIARLFRVSLLSGVTFANAKFYGAPADRSFEGLVGERGDLQFTRHVQLQQSFNFYPNFTNMGQYRFDTTSSLGFHLNSWLSTNLTLTDFYISEIPPGAGNTLTIIGPSGTVESVKLPVHNNNLTLTAGIGVDF